MVERSLKLVGVDTFSIDPLDSDDFPAMRLLLSTGILAMESLDLTAVPGGDYLPYCLRLKVAAAEAAPVRAIPVS